eukprot:4778647-Alexandrium_andersonii.AAC.1
MRCQRAASPKTSRSSAWRCSACARAIPSGPGPCGRRLRLPLRELLGALRQRMGATQTAAPAARMRLLQTRPAAKPL